MSLIAIAEAIDLLVETKQAYIKESETIVTVSALSSEHASSILALCKPLEWPVSVFDSANEIWSDIDALDSNFAPYRLAIQKPNAPTDTLQLLSNHAFAQWLESGHPASRWHIARMTEPIVVGTGVIQPWDGVQKPGEMAPTKSPRTLVREFGNVRQTPEDVRFWLSSALSVDQYSHSATQIWVRAAASALINCLPDEIDSDGEALKFRGPPRLSISKFDPTTEALDQSTFNTLREVIHWVFENEREAEMRHILLAAELARAGTTFVNISTFLRQHLTHAWESAQIAYQMALAETGRDTLKVLSDLRKAVTEETAKLSDMGRQLTGSVAAALATGIGLIAARVAANAPAELVVIVMLIIALYTAMTITSGVQFMRLQRQLRSEWQHRLYRFLPDAEYTRMVATPTTKAEISFIWTAWLGGISVAVLTLTCAWVVLTPDSSAPKLDKPKISDQAAIKVKPASAPSNVTETIRSNKASSATTISGSTKSDSKTPPVSKSSK